MDFPFSISLSRYEGWSLMDVEGTAIIETAGDPLQPDDWIVDGIVFQASKWDPKSKTCLHEERRMPVGDPLYDLIMAELMASHRGDIGAAWAELLAESTADGEAAA